jgi:hypothetical protein
MKNTILTLFFICFSLTQIKAQSAEEIVQANLDAYNNRDIDLFMEYIADDIEMYNLAECEPYMRGKEMVRDRYAAYFENSPQLHSEIKKRIVFDNKVIDHEYITGSNGSSEPFEMIFMYEVKDGLIVKTTAIRKSN